jgi:hypothetical protein
MKASRSLARDHVVDVVEHAAAALVHQAQQAEGAGAAVAQHQRRDVGRTAAGRRPAAPPGPRRAPPAARPARAHRRWPGWRRWSRWGTSRAPRRPAAPRGRPPRWAPGRGRSSGTRTPRRRRAAWPARPASRSSSRRSGGRSPPAARGGSSRPAPAAAVVDRDLGDPVDGGQPGGRVDRRDRVEHHAVPGEPRPTNDAPLRIGTPGVVPRHMMAPPHWMGGCCGCICARTAECRPSAATSSAAGGFMAAAVAVSSSAVTPSAVLAVAHHALAQAHGVGAQAFAHRVGTAASAAARGAPNTAASGSRPARPRGSL